VSANFKHNLVLLVGGGAFVFVCLYFGMGAWTVLPALAITAALRY
jgi:hypothetical protein